MHPKLVSIHQSREEEQEGTKRRGKRSSRRRRRSAPTFTIPPNMYHMLYGRLAIEEDLVNSIVLSF